jgi:hypothetical protein
MMDATSRLIRDIENERRAAKRRWLWANDPQWRDRKRAANQADRDAMHAAGLKLGRVNGKRKWVDARS